MYTYIPGLLFLAARSILLESLEKLGHCLRNVDLLNSYSIQIQPLI